jgi:hypothetical protein
MGVGAPSVDQTSPDVQERGNGRGAGRYDRAAWTANVQGAVQRTKGRRARMGHGGVPFS